MFVSRISFVTAKPNNRTNSTEVNGVNWRILEQENGTV